MNQLKRLLASYKLKVIQVQPHEDGYIIVTNKGKKLITIWTNVDLLRWSNTWREELAVQGHKPVQRFLTNTNKKKYIRYQGKYFVLSDFCDGRTIDLQSEDECSAVGEVFAKFHKALDRIDQKMTIEISGSLNEDYFTQGSTMIKQVIKTIEEKSRPTLIDEMIYANLPLLYKRFRRAHQLWEGIQDSIIYFPVSFSKFNLNQIAKEENDWYIQGGINQSLSTMHQDTVHLIRDIYQKSEWKLQSVISFLEGYNRQRKLSDNELIYVLVQFAIPWDVWAHFEDYLTNDHLTEDKIERVVEDIRNQRYWDELTAFLGRFIDDKNKASA